MNETEYRSDAAGGHEAGYYEAMTQKMVACHLCPHECRIWEGKTGRCRSRRNRDGYLWSEAYGRVCACQVDPIEKKPLFHFYPGTDCFSLAAVGCNLSCLHCQNWAVSQAEPADVESRFLLPDDVAGWASRCACPVVAYTYTEPLTYLEYTRDCARACRERGLKNVLVTAGYVNEKPLDDLLPYIDAANVDLKSFSDDIYRSVSHAHLAPVLRTLQQMRAAGVWVEITNLLIPGVNDDEEMIRNMCVWLVEQGFADNPLHFSRFFPQYRMQDRPPTPVVTLQNARKVAQECGLKYVYLGNVDLPGSGDTVCPQCGALLVRRIGYQVDTEGFDGRCSRCGERISGRFTDL